MTIKYEIKITGSGDKYHILDALEKLIHSLKYQPEDGLEQVYEDEILCTEISVIE
jgi:hypothetical protein